MKTQTNGNMFFEDHVWVTVSERKVKNLEKGFFKKNIIEKRINDFLISFENKTIFGGGPKRRLVKENQDKK